MSAPSNTKRYVVGVVTGFVVVNVLVVVWAAVAAADPSRARSVIDVLYPVGLWGAGGLAVAALSGSRLISDSLNWWRLVWFVAGGAALTNLLNGYTYFGAWGYSVLYRDVVASIVYAVALTLVAARLGSYLYQRNMSGRIRAILCATAAVAAVVPAPILLLLVHCTSGDCL